MDILFLIDRLENLITSSKRMPLVNQIIVKETDILNIIEQIRLSIPNEIKQARRIIQDKERIVTQAQTDATNVLTHAREEAANLMTREGLLEAAELRSQEIIRRANEQAQRIVRQAEEHTARMQIEADSYASETLRSLREHLLSLETEIERSVMSIERGLESLDGQPSHAVDNRQPALQQPPYPLTRRASLTIDDNVDGTAFRP